MHSYLGHYASLGLLLIVGVGFLSFAFAANRLLRPNAPSAAKSSTYECGVDPVGGDWANSHIRYFVYAYFYVLFAVESVFVFPWAAVFSNPHLAATTAVEMGIFIGVVALGVLYGWRKGVLRWV